MIRNHIESQGAAQPDLNMSFIVFVSSQVLST